MSRTLLALAIVLLAVAGEAAAQPQQPQTTTFRIEPVTGLVVDTQHAGFLDVMPNGTRVHNVTLRNEGNETLDLTASAQEAAPSMEAAGMLQASVAPTNLTLAPGENATLTVTITAAEHAKNGTRTAVGMRISRAEPQQNNMPRLHVIIGPPCEDCKPDENGGAVTYYSRSPAGGAPPGGVVYHSSTPIGGAPGATVETRAPGNGTTPTTPASSREDDPYNEVPGAPPVLVAALAGIAALLRRVRRPRFPTRLARKAALPLMFLALLAPAGHAAPSEAKDFALTRVARAGNDVDVTLYSPHVTASRVTVSMLSRAGGIIGGEQTVHTWWPNETRVFRFADVAATEGTVRIHYLVEDKYREERLPVAIPERSNATSRLDVLDIERPAAGTLRVNVVNVGDEDAGPALVRLEDAAGIRISEPTMRRVDALAVHANATVEFSIPENATSVVVVAEHDGVVDRVPLRLPAAPTQSIRLLGATLADDDTATFTIMNTGATRLVNVFARVALPDGSIVGEPALHEIPRLATNQPVEIRTRLPEETRDVRLLIDVGGNTTNFPVRLTDAEGDATPALRVQTDLPAREAAPNTVASYDLKVHNDGGKDATVTLRADGLPPGYDATFSVGNSAARTLVVPAGATRDVNLKIRVPDSAARDAVGGLTVRVVAEGHEGASAGVDLRLSVQGAPRLDLTASNWHTDAKAGERVRATVTVRNVGTGTARDITPSFAAPPGWDVAFEPAIIAALAPGDRVEVAMSVTPPTEAASGRFAIDVGVNAGDTAARTRSFVVEIAKEEASRLPWIAGAGLAAIAATGLVVKLRRR